MRKRRRSITADLSHVSGVLLTPLRWLVLLGILVSSSFSFGVQIHRPGIVAAVIAYAALAIGIACLHGRPFTRYAIERLLLAADLLFSAVIFHLSSGIRSPYFGLWYLALIHAALVVGLRASLAVAVAVMALVVADELIMPGGREALRDLNLALGKVLFLPLIAWAAGQLAQEIRDREVARRQAARRALVLEAAEVRVRQEMEIARRVQESLLPLSLPTASGLCFATLFRPAKQVGGDIYDVIELRDGRVLLAVADVSGKGVPAALLAVAVQQGIRRFAGPDPAAVLAGVNQLLMRNIPDDMFVTAACVVLDPRGAAAVASAGHPPPLWRDGRGRRIVPMGRPGPALGLLPKWFGPTERWCLAPGDALLVYTDGVLDAKTDASQRLGEETLVALMGRAVPEDAREWIEQLRHTLAACVEWPDDITAVAVSRQAVMET